jgi:hypothetical protein
MTMSCARALTVAVEPVCGVRRLRLAYGARCPQRHRPRAVEGRAAPRLRGHAARRPSRRGPLSRRRRGAVGLRLPARHERADPRVRRLVAAAYRPSRARGGRASAGGDRHFPFGRRERAQGRRVRGRSLKGATAMPHRSSGSPSSTSRTPRFERPAWDAALRPAQRRAGLGRARLEQRRLADARRQRLITVWLRELANH